MGRKKGSLNVNTLINGKVCWRSCCTIIEEDVLKDFKKICKRNKITPNAFIKSCIYAFTYPDKVAYFEDLFDYMNKLMNKDTVFIAPNVKIKNVEIV